MTRLRIAMISEHASPLVDLGGVDAGGQNTHVAALAAALAERGHRVHVYTRRDSATLPDEVPTEAGVTVVHVPAGPPRQIPKDDLLPYMGDFGRWLDERWREGDGAPDAVHAHFWMSGMAGVAAMRQRRLPFVLTYHALGSVKRRMQGDKDTSPDSRIVLERMLGRAADVVIAQSTDEMSELLRCGVPRQHIVRIPSGVDTDLFSPMGPAADLRDGDSSRPVILTVGRMVERKGFADLIRVLPHVPRARLVVVGGPPAPDLKQDPLAARLMRLADKLKVADRVRLLGAVAHADMPLLYRAADVVACTPWYEPFGITPLEAMASGTPVVTYAVGGLKESVVDGVSGVLVPARDVRSLALALRRLLGDQVSRMSYASAAVDRARSRYQWPRQAADMERAYERAIHGSAERGTESLTDPAMGVAS